MSINTQRQFRLKTFFEDNREVDVLIRSLARKLLRENKTDLPASVLSSITGVSEDLWVKTYSDRRNFLNDILTPVVLEASRDLESLDREERNFLDKLHQVLHIIYKINFSYPEIIILFQGIITDEGMDEKLQISRTMEELMQQTFRLLCKQAYIEKIVEKGSSMEKLLLFLIHQMMLTFQNQLYEYCDDYLEKRDGAVFPEEEQWIKSLMAPIVEQLEGFTAT